MKRWYRFACNVQIDDADLKIPSIEVIGNSMLTMLCPEGGIITTSDPSLTPHELGNILPVSAAPPLRHR